MPKNALCRKEEIIKVELNERLEPIVSGRELHRVLEVGSNYTTWFSRMSEYGFVENQDFVSVWSDSKTGNGVEYLGSPQKMSARGYELDHAMKLDIAKEIAMLQRNEKGRQVRQYFIQVEKDFNSPEKIMARALKIAEHQINILRIENTQQQAQIEADKPKVLFADAVSVSKTSILIGELAKILKQNGVDTGEKRLFAYLRDTGYLIKRNGTDYNSPTQKSMELGLFEVKETTVTHSDGHVTISKTTKVTGKGQQYFINKFLQNKGADTYA